MLVVESFLISSLTPVAGVVPIPTFSLLSIVIAVASALSSIPWEVKAPWTVTAPAKVESKFSSIVIAGVVPTAEPLPIIKSSAESSNPI